MDGTSSHRWAHPSPALAKRCLLLLAISIPIAKSQLDRLFVPQQLSAVAPARLAFRAQGFADGWRDPNIRTVVLQNRIVLEPEFWRQQFQDMGGVAVLGPELKLPNYTITSDTSDVLAAAADSCNAVNCTTDSSKTVGHNTDPAELNVSQMAGAFLIQSGGMLTFEDVVLSEIATASDYTYTPYQPYRSQGVGTGTWPTIGMAPNATLVLTNTTLQYRNPAPLDACAQYTARAVFNLLQVYGQANVSMFNGTAGVLIGPLSIAVQVLNGSTNETLGQALAQYSNVTFSCLEKEGAQQGGLSPAMLAVAIAVPVGVVLLAATLAAWCCLRRRHRRRQQAAETAAAGKDVEASQGLQHDLNGATDQYVQDDRAHPLAGQLVPSLSTPSYSTYGSAASAATTMSSTSPPIILAGQPVPGQQQYPTGQAQSLQMVAFTGGSAAASASTASGIQTHIALFSVPPSQRPLHDTSSPNMAPHTPGIGNIQRVSTSSASSPAVVATLGSIGPMDPAWVNQSADPSSRAASSEPRGSGQVYAAYHAGSSGAAAGSGGASGGASADASGGGGPGTGSGGASGPGSGGSVVGPMERRQAMPALLKARSQVAVLRDLKIGPLLGRGSYGKVYKGRWKAVTVAVKIIEHNERTPGTASSGGKRINIGRESLLATNMSHPNVVQTYHISTMTVSQRNALANGMLVDGPTATEAVKQPKQPGNQSMDKSVDDSGSNNSGSEEEHTDPLETWMLMEYCEKGSLERAMARGKFIRREDRQPEMIGIYKALLDTASGLDYLHSIGVVHGDLKTANVLLKGSARDVRGFACKISDFGLSRVLDMDATHISTRTYGTIVYMPSELLLEGRMTTATDIYSFGLMMWELMTSTRVFEEGLSIGQIFYMIAYQAWRPTVPPNCPPGYAQLMTACWHQDPEQRPTVQQLLRSLQKLYVAEKRHIAAEKQAAAEASETGPQSHRVSFDTTESDRDGAAAAAANEAFLATSPAGAGTNRSFVLQAPAAAGQHPDTGMQSGLLMLTAAGPGSGMEAAAAAASRQAFGAAAAANGGVCGQPGRFQRTASGCVTGSNNTAHSGGSVEPGHSSGGRGGHSSSGGEAGGGGGGHGSGAGAGGSGGEPYLDWAAAVSQGSLSNKNTHGQSGTGVGVGGRFSRDSGLSAGEVSAARRMSATTTSGLKQGNSAYIAQKQQQQPDDVTATQSARLGMVFQQVFGQQTAPTYDAAIQARTDPSVFSHMLNPAQEIQPDIEAVTSNVSNLQQFSSTSNVMGGAGEDDMYDDASGFLEAGGMHRPTAYAYSQQHSHTISPAVPADGVPGLAAQGFVDAMTSSGQAGQGQAGLSGPAWQPGLSGVPLPGTRAHQQQQSPAYTLTTGASGFPDWPSVSTGSMPPTLASSFNSQVTGSYSTVAGRYGSRLSSSDQASSFIERPVSSSTAGSSSRLAGMGSYRGRGLLDDAAIGTGTIPSAVPQGGASLAATTIAAAGAAVAAGSNTTGTGGIGFFGKMVSGWSKPGTPPPAGAVELGASDVTAVQVVGEQLSTPPSPFQAAAAGRAPEGTSTHCAGLNHSQTSAFGPAQAITVDMGGGQDGALHMWPGGPGAAAVPGAAGGPSPSTSYGMLQTVEELPSSDNSTATVPPIAAAPGGSESTQVTRQQQQQRQQQPKTPAASPFAALSQRAGSLFGPV